MFSLTIKNIIMRPSEVNFSMAYIFKNMPGKFCILHAYLTYLSEY